MGLVSDPMSAKDTVLETVSYIRFFVVYKELEAFKID